MEYRYVGSSGLRVSPICMGTMSFGTWSDKSESFRILDTAFDRGVNFFDTAEIYPVPPTAEMAGLSEEIFGQWIKTQQNQMTTRAKDTGRFTNNLVWIRRKLMSMVQYQNINDRRLHGQLFWRCN